MKIKFINPIPPYTPTRTVTYLPQIYPKIINGTTERKDIPCMQDDTAKMIYPANKPIAEKKNTFTAPKTISFCAIFSNCPPTLLTADTIPTIMPMKNNTEKHTTDFLCNAKKSFIAYTDLLFTAPIPNNTFFSYQL